MMHRPSPPCPRCHSSDVVPIMYGLPGTEAIADVEAGRVVLGGCGVWDGMPEFRCRACGEGIGAVRFDSSGPE